MWTLYLLNLEQDQHLIIHLLHCLLVRIRGRGGKGAVRESLSHPGLRGSTRDLFSSLYGSWRSS